MSYPPTLAMSRLVQRIKGKTSYKLLHEFKSLRKAFWGNHLWARGYFVCSSGNITDEAIKAYIDQQDMTPNADFRVHDDPLAGLEPESSCRLQPERDFSPHRVTGFSRWFSLDTPHIALDHYLASRCGIAPPWEAAPTTEGAWPVFERL